MAPAAYELYIWAPAGALVIFDTHNVHRGTAGAAASSRRWSLTSYYTSDPRPGAETCSLGRASPMPNATALKPPLRRCR